MIEDSGGKRHNGRNIRIVLVSFVALLVLGIGVALQPRAAEQATPSFSETARTSALTDALALADSARRLEAAQPETAKGSDELAATVELLATHARALQSPTGGPSATTAPTGSANATDPEATDPEAPNPAVAAAGKRDELLASLAASSSRRLGDAAASDGGTARLLAAVGTAQLLQATKLAAVWGLKAPDVAVPDGGAAAALPPESDDGPRTAERLPSTGASDPAKRSPATEAPTTGCPAPSPGSAGGAGTAGEAGMTTGAAVLPRALEAAVRAELEAVYAYQVALTRLDPGKAAAASAYLAKHQEALRHAEATSRLTCVDIPPREAGYRLPATFATAPARALGSLETYALPVYGDLVALSPESPGPANQSSGSHGPGTRSWAIAMLVASAQRAQSWAESVQDFPGIILDSAELPALQSPTAPASPGATSRAG